MQTPEVVTTGHGNGDGIDAVARERRPCEYCETQHDGEFVLRELVNRALVDMTEAGALGDGLAAGD